MKKTTFYVIEAHNPTTGKYYSHAEKVPNCYNLVGKFTAIDGFEVISVNACDTWKEAQEIADFWNEGAKKRNKYAF
jgi:hypothetical protein